MNPAVVIACGAALLAASATIYHSLSTQVRVTVTERRVQALMLTLALWGVGIMLIGFAMLRGKA